MDNQEQFNQSVSQKSENSIRIVIITILITAVIVGGGIYYWQDITSNKESQRLKNEIEELNNQLSKTENRI